VRTIDVEELSWDWREAFEAARSATAAASTMPFAPSLGGEAARLAAERKMVVADLRAFARVHGLDVAVDHLAVSVPDVRRLLGLPPDVTTCVFNLDGVLLPSASLHAAAWKETFDKFLLERAERTRGHFVTFDPRDDYYAHIHGRPRLDGVRVFLASRGIRLAEGSADDAPGTETVHGLANRKRAALLRRLERERLDALRGSRHYLEVAREAGLHRVVVSASANAVQMLNQAGLRPLVEAYVDGSAMDAEHLHAKPAPDTLLAACAKVAADPHHAVAFETTPAGLAAAHTAGFELVIGVDDGGNLRMLRGDGADRVVGSLAELLEQQVAA
jgi:HAD superfamily hydrolase (TIGR01509 family)